MTTLSNGFHYVLCLKNRGYGASLDVRKVCRVLDDGDAPSHGLLRIVDESGEDYLYPAKYFVPIDVPKTVTRMFSKVSA